MRCGGSGIMLPHDTSIPVDQCRCHPATADDGGSARRSEFPMVLQLAATVLASLLLALPAAVPAGPDTAPASSLRAAQSSPGQPAALAGPPGAPPGVCPTGTGYGPPLPLTSVTPRDPRRVPSWRARLGRRHRALLFRSWARHRVGDVQPSTIRRFSRRYLRTFLSGSGSNGLALTPDGQHLLAATHDQRSVSTYRLDHLARGVVACYYQGRAFNSPNDLTVRSGRRRLLHRPRLPARQPPDQMCGRTRVFRVSGGQSSR